MITRRNLLSSISILAIPGMSNLMAEEAAVKKTDDMSSKNRNLHFLKPDSVDFKNLLPAPPDSTADENKAELELLLHLQRTRTDAEVKIAEAAAKLTISSFADCFGNWFSAETLPETSKLLLQMEADAKFYGGAAKEFFKRSRPAHDSRIQPALKSEDVFSYPSGIATRGILFALTLSELAPAKKEAVLDRGRSIGWARCVVGLHYPSDIIAGRSLGQLLFQSMSIHPKFQDTFKSARAEMAQAKK